MKHAQPPRDNAGSPDVKPNDHDQWSDALLEVLNRQRDAVTELAELAERQGELIESGKTGRLLALLTHRQRLIERFGETQRQLGEMTDDMDERMDAVADAVRARIQDLIAEIGDRLSDVMKRDEADQQALEDARGARRKEIAALDANRSARQAYVGRPATPSRFADERG